MPTPNTVRDSFLKYLRHNYQYGYAWIDANGYHSAEDVKEALRGLMRTDDVLYRIVHLYTSSHMTRHMMSARVSYDYSTIKRKLDYAVDCLLNRLANKDIVGDRVLEFDRK